DDEIATLPDAVARTGLTEVQRDSPDEHGRIETPVREQPSSQRCRRGLSMRPGHDDRSGAPEKLLANDLRQRAVPDLPFEHFFEFRIPSRDRVTNDDEVEIGGDVVGR